MGYYNSGGFDVGTAVAYLDLNTLAFNSAIEQSQRLFQDFADQSVSAAQKWQSVGQGLTNLGSTITKNVTTPIVGLAESSIQAYRDFETAFTGVRKTVELTDEDMVKLGVTWDDLEDIIVDMAQSTASSSEEIAGIMEIAGQLGIQLGEGGKDIEKFTKTMVMLGDSTNLSAAEAADALARFSNITGGNVKNIDRLGAAIVSLGNNFATQEDEIVMMSTRLASAGTIAGLTETEILALATAMTSVGIKAEAGGTAMSQTLSQITKIIANASDTTAEGAEEASEALTTLASVSGMTSDEFVKTWKEHPIEAIQAFIGGLGDMSDNAEETVLTLESLGMTGIRQSNMLRSLALSSENMAAALETSNTAYEENTALTDEANKRYETLDSKINQLNERWKEMKRDLAEMLIPILEQLMDILQQIIDWWMSLDEETKQSIVNFALFAAAIGPVISVVGNVITVISTLVRIFTSVGSVIKTVVTSFEKFKVALDLTKAGYTGFESISKLGVAFANIKNILSAIIKGISGVGSVISGAIIAIASFVDMWQNGWSVIKTILEALGIALAAVGAVILGAPAAVAAVVAGVVFALSQVVLAVKENWDSIVGFFTESVPNWWNNTVLPWFSNIDEHISNLFDGIWDIVFGLFEKIRNGLGEFFKSIYDKCSDEMKAVVGYIQNIVLSIVEIVENLFYLVIEGLKTFFLTIWYTITGNFDKVREVLSNFIDTVKGVFESLVLSIERIFHNISLLLATFFANVIPKVKQFFSDIINGVVSFCGNILSNIISFFSNILGKISGFIQNVLPNLSSFFTSILSKVASLLALLIMKVTSGIATILTFFSNLPGNFFNIGKNIFQGLWNGLKSVWSSIWGWLQDIWNNVTNFFGNLWGKISGGLSFNGSHANGLDYVPFNGYVAQLHEGERVLTKEEARDYNNGNTSGGKGGDTFNFYNTKPDPYEYARQMKRAKKELAMI